MDSSQEVSPSPPPSSTGFKGALAKARKSRKNDGKGAARGAENDSTSDRDGLRTSQDAGLERSRSVRAASIDGSIKSLTGSSKVAKLIPGRSRRKKKQQEQEAAELELHRGRSAGDIAATGALENNKSRSTLGDGEGSLITVESDLDSPSLTRPSLSSHNSHIGYLTTSSPLIKTTVTTDAPSSDSLPESDSNLGTKEKIKSSTLPIQAKKNSESSSSLSPLHSATFDTRRGSTASSSKGSRSRGTSPAARIRDALSVGGRQKDGNGSKSPTDRVSSVSGDGGSLGDLFKRRKPASTNGSGTLDTISSGPQSKEGEPTRNADVPAIVTIPHTPPSSSLEGPKTTVTPPTPTDGQRRQDERSSFSESSRPMSSGGNNPNITVSPSGNMISHRRIRSDSASHVPSKLSQTLPTPLTPTAEEMKTPGGTLRTPSQGSMGAGFFSSVFSVAQNMTTTLTNTISNPTNRSRSSTQTTEDAAGPQEAQAYAPGPSAENILDEANEKKPLAVHSLGSGELSLRHLGISTESLANGSSIGGSPPKSEGKTGLGLIRDDSSILADDASAAKAVSAAYSEKPVTETPVVDDDASQRAKSSIYEGSVGGNGERTPPNSVYHDGNESLKRSTSVRSRVGDVVRKHRNSSSTTGNTFAAAVGAGAALANPATSRPTGFAVASKKRNREFHSLFRSVPEDDFLIEDYSCALQREIILAGRIYISEGHICFFSNILGWVTNLVISFDEIVAVEKENTAVVFPNAIAIQTLHARHTFRSLLSREATYELIIGIWKLSHPNLQSSVNGARLDRAGNGDKTEKTDVSGSDDPSALSDEDGEEIYDEDQEDDAENGSVHETLNGSVTSTAVGEEPKTVSRKVSSMANAVGSAATPGPTASDTKAAAAAAQANAASVDYPGPSNHAPTECPDGATHFDKQLADDIIPAPLGKVYSMVFGPASGGFMAKWLMDDMKCTDLQFEDDKKGLSDEQKTRSLSYIKPLNAPIGPKTTKCVVNEQLDFIDLDKAVCVTQSTQTPDVPSGNVFVTKTHTCFMWAANNQTRAIMNYTIEWTGKSWLKVPIEKAATEGQTAYCNDLTKALKAGLAAPRTRTATSGVKVKGKGGKRGLKSPSETSKLESEDSSKQQEVQKVRHSWGLLEPIHNLLSPIIDLLSPLTGSNTIIGVLLLLLLWNYTRPAVSPASSSGLTGSYYPPPSTPERLAAYEELWRREESDLWDWLDHRIGVHTLLDEEAATNAKTGKNAMKKKISALDAAKQKVLKGAGGASEKEVKQAIRLTQEKLSVLKEVMLDKDALKEAGDTNSG